MKLKATSSIVSICQEPMGRLEVWIDEISNGVDIIEHIYRETYYRRMDTEPAAIAIWAKLALEFATSCPGGTMLAPFQLRAFVDAVHESLRHQGEENAWVNLPGIF